MRPPGSSGSHPLSGRAWLPRCCAGSSSFCRCCQFSWAPRPRPCAGSLWSCRHCRRHHLALMRPPGSAGGHLPLRERFFTALLRGEFFSPSLAPVSVVAIFSSLCGSLPNVGHGRRHNLGRCSHWAQRMALSPQGESFSCRADFLSPSLAPIVVGAISLPPRGYSAVPSSSLPRPSSRPHRHHKLVVMEPPRLAGGPPPLQGVLIIAPVRGEHAFPAVTIAVPFAEADMIIKRRHRWRRYFDGLVVAAKSSLPPVFGGVVIVLVVAVPARPSSRVGIFPRLGCLCRLPKADNIAACSKTNKSKFSVSIIYLDI